MDFAEVLQFLRKKNGLTQKQLSTEIGISLSSIISYENGLRRPNSKALAKLEAYFQVSGDYLLGKLPLDLYEKNMERVAAILPERSTVIKQFKEEFHFISFEDQSSVLQAETVFYSFLLNCFIHQRNFSRSDFPNMLNDILIILSHLNSCGKKEYIKRGKELIQIEEYKATE